MVLHTLFWMKINEWLSAVSHNSTWCIPHFIFIVNLFSLTQIVNRVSWGVLTSTTSLVSRVTAPSCVEHQFPHFSCKSALMFTAGRRVITSASNNISRETFKYIQYISVCLQEPQPLSLMLHSGPVGKMVEKSFHLTNLIHISPEAVNIWKCEIWG